MGQDKYLYFSGSAQEVSGPPTFSFHGDSVIGSGDLSIVMKTDTNGNAKWIKNFNSTLSVNAFTGITLLPNSKVAAVGGFAGTVSCGAVSISIPGGSGQNAYFAIVDSGSNLVTLKEIFGDAGCFANAVTSDGIGNVYFGGLVGDSVWAGVPAIPAYHSVGGNSDFFVMKYGVDCSCTSAPSASFTDTGTHTIGVTYTGTATGLDSVVWSYGDGTSGTGTSATHTYSASGTYHVCVTAYTECGSDVHCTDVVIHIPSEVTPILMTGREVKVFPEPGK